MADDEDKKAMQSFEEFITTYGDGQSEQERRETEARLWEIYGRHCAVFVSDLSGFSRLTEKYSIVHFLAMIHQCRRLLRPVITSHGGQLIKTAADNIYAIFDTVPHAIDASIEMQRTLVGHNEGRHPDWQIGLCVGIGFGKILVIEDQDFYGHELNLSFKLGEDIAEPGEILVTVGAMEQVKKEDYPHEPRTVLCSGITIRHVAVQY